jgi:hypothetical protein
MTDNLPRIGLGAVVAGVAVALATSTMLSLFGAVALAGPAGVTPGPIVDNSAAVGLGLALAVAIGASLGGRVTAMVGRALVRRDGALAGILCGSVLALVLLVAAVWAAGLWPAGDAATLLAGVAALELVALLTSLLGGISGARSEAQTVGLRTVRVARRASKEAYEQDFFSGESLSHPTH